MGAKKKAGKRAKVRILVVDDYEDNRVMYAEYLRFVGYEVDTAKDGAEALKKAHAQLPRVVVMDLSLPGLDGWEATIALRQHPKTRHMSIVAVTGHGEPFYTKKALDAGCDDVLIKPLEPSELAKRIAEYCR